MKLPPLTLLTDLCITREIPRPLLELLFKRLRQLAPGQQFYLPPTEPSYDRLYVRLTEILQEPNRFPEPVLQAFHDIEALFPPKALSGTTSERSAALAEAIRQWLNPTANNPATVAPQPSEGEPIAPQPSEPAIVEAPKPGESTGAPPMNTATAAPSTSEAASVSSASGNGSPCTSLPPENALPRAISSDALACEDHAALDKGDASCDTPRCDAPRSHAPRLRAGPSTINSQPSTTPPLTLKLCVLFFTLEPRASHDFIRVFHTDLLDCFPDLPQPTPGDDSFFEAVIPLLKEPEKLPPRMIDALLGIQELAAPANRPLLLGLLAQTGIPAPADTPPEHLAVEFWLRCPFISDRLETLRAQLPEEFLNPPPPAGPLNPHLSAEALAKAEPSTLNHSSDLAVIARYPRYVISHLPPEIRESINQMLRQRIPYAQILQKLGDHAKGINKSSLSRWKKTGYLLWLAEQQRREDAQAQLQLLMDILRENDNAKIHEATQQIAALRINQVLAAFDPSALIQALQQHPQAFVRLIQTLPSLSRGGMDCERLLVDLAERRATLLKQQQPKKRGISAAALACAEQELNLM